MTLRRSGPGSECLHVVVLTSWMRFPRGMAATNRAALIGRALATAGAGVHFVIMQASERPPLVENDEVRGVHRGLSFEYTCGTTRRHDSFLMRRLIELRGWTAGAVRLWQLRSAGKLDVVYLWFTSQRLGLARLIYLSLLRAMRVPVVIELNERPWSCRLDRRAIERRWSPLMGTAGAVSISAFLSDWAVREARRLALPFELIEVPIVVDLEESSVRPYPEGPLTVVFAGAPQYDDTLRFIFEAMTQVWQRFPECRLVVTGSGPAEPAAQWLLQAAKAGGLDARIDVAGYLRREELLGLYSKAHALLIPLFDDVRSQARFPTKIGEYLASGRPIVTTSVGEMPRFFTDRRTAFMCAPGDVSAYAAKIVEVLADPGFARGVGEAGRKVAAGSFSYALYRNDLLTGFTRAAARFPGGGHAG